MPFSGGGGGQLTNHVHDNTPLQGGPLSFNGTTIGGMNAGDITFSDGAALQTLAYPGVPAGETLTASALSTAHSWVAAATASSAVELLGSAEQGAAANALNLSFPSTSFADVSAIDVYFSAYQANSNDWNITINGLTGATSYIIQRSQMKNGTLTNTQVSRPNINTPLAQFIGGHMRIICQDPSTTAGAYNYLFFSGEISGFDNVSALNSYQWFGGHYSATSITAVNAVNLACAGGVNMEAGAVISAYKTNRT